MQQTALSSNLQMTPAPGSSQYTQGQRDRDRLEEWPNMNLMKLSKNKYKALKRRTPSWALPGWKQH